MNERLHIKIKSAAFGHSFAACAVSVIRTAMYATVRTNATMYSEDGTLHVGRCHIESGSYDEDIAENKEQRSFYDRKAFGVANAPPA